MNKKKLSLLLSIAILFLTLAYGGADAVYGEEHQEEGSPYRYEYEIKTDGTVKITDVLPSDILYPQSVSEKCIIPSEIEGRQVTEIGYLAFARESLKFYYVFIPSTVITIDERAFSLKNLQEVVMEEGVQEIGKDAFTYCMQTLKKVVLPRSITSINDSFGHNSFNKCEFYTYKDCYAAEYLKEKMKGYVCEYLDEYKKEKDGITVWTDDSDMGDQGISLAVQCVTEGEYFDRVTNEVDGISCIYQISYQADDQPVEPHGSYYRIQIPYWSADERVIYSQFYQIGEDGGKIPIKVEETENGMGFNAVLTVDSLGDILAVGNYKIGDMNGNGSLEAADALLVLKVVTEKQALSAGQLLVADMDQDGSVTAEDALRILKNIVRMELDWYYWYC